MRDEIIKNDENTNIGQNIRRLRKERKIGQTEIVRLVQLQGVSLTRESLVKIERGVQHIKVGQLRAIRDILDVSYNDLLDGNDAR